MAGLISAATKRLITLLAGNTGAANIGTSGGVTVEAKLAAAATTYAPIAGNSAQKFAVANGVAASDAASVGQVPSLVKLVGKRQCATSAPVDANGLPSLGGATGSMTLTTTNISPGTPLAVNAAGGVSASGGLADRVGYSAANLVWNGLSVNGTLYLYVDVAADGTLTTGNTALQPKYQRAGALSTVSGQFTFNYGVMNQAIGTGAGTAQSYRVFLGEVIVVGGVVTYFAWYALNGESESAVMAITGPGIVQSFQHLLGCEPQEMISKMVNSTAEGGFLPGDESTDYVCQAAGVASKASTRTDRINADWGIPQGTSAATYLLSYTTGYFFQITPANWGIKFIAKRPF